MNNKKYYKRKRYGKDLKNYDKDRGKAPVELIGIMTENSDKYFKLKITKDEYSMFNRKIKMIPKSVATWVRLDDNSYRVIIPFWLHTSWEKDR